ncbi:MAG: DUF4921 family protein [Corynebacterium sp.]|uniref:DUF4921 family protein n=1 Tax=Corynebacterium sp. TaxID=1720 RepID=UPI0026DB55FC|nr:DUF4921 family protein [Corynebacterium sp.]MDO5099060.1 DUF4921 family protein [Corynebacterium sp.]
MTALSARINPIQVMADGTVKQINPFSGTEVWTVPGRGNRPLTQPQQDHRPLDPAERETTCAFCENRKLETPPEKSRVIRSGDNWEIVRGVPAAELDSTHAEFRRVPNLFEIVTYEYWKANYQYEMDPSTATRMAEYLSSPLGKQHVLDTVETKRAASGEDTPLTESELLQRAECFFGGGHDIIIGRRHFIDDATDHSQLASSGTLTPEEHFAFTTFTVDSMRDLYARNRYAPYVAVFQNWLKPAGASFDHLHKQLVAIDERGFQAEHEISKLRQNPNMYNEWAVDYAATRNLIIAENDHAVCFAGFGHRFPTLEVFSKSATPEPWLQSTAEIQALSDLVHACHAAAGPDIPCNEEWHHKPIDLDIPTPWRVMIKWRVSTLAGFEGGTKIYLNTISPWDMRDRVVSAMYGLRKEGKIAANIRIATECRVQRNSLKYNPLLQR